MVAAALLKTMDACNYFVYFSRIDGIARRAAFWDFPDMPILEQKYPEPCIRILVCARQALRAGGWNYANLSAPFWRLYWNAGPGAFICIGRSKTRLAPSKAYVLTPNTPFAARNPRPVDHFYLHFLTRAPYTAVAPGIYAFHAGRPAAAAIADISEALRRLRHDPAAAREAMAVPAHLLAYLALQAVPADKFRSPRSLPRIARVLAEMEARLDREMRNDRMAALIGMNTNAFIRLFKQAMDMTPQEYLRHKRIEQACLFLRYTDKTIEGIAAETGFCDRYHFTRVFQRLRGLGPAAFRKIRA